MSGSDNSHFYFFPNVVAVDTAGDIYVADAWNGREQKFNSSHLWQMTIGNL